MVQCGVNVKDVSFSCSCADSEVSMMVSHSCLCTPSMMICSVINSKMKREIASEKDEVCVLSLLCCVCIINIM